MLAVSPALQAPPIMISKAALRVAYEHTRGAQLGQFCMTRKIRHRKDAGLGYARSLWIR